MEGFYAENGPRYAMLDGSRAARLKAAAKEINRKFAEVFRLLAE